jgi:hypothetical protein
MQPSCVDRMKTARELLEHGVLTEGAEQLLKLHGCGCRTGCEHWNRCINLVEGQWRISRGVTAQRASVIGR